MPESQTLGKILLPTTLYKHKTHNHDAVADSDKFVYMFIIMLRHPVFMESHSHNSRESFLVFLLCRLVSLGDGDNFSFTSQLMSGRDYDS